MYSALAVEVMPWRPRGPLPTGRAVTQELVSAWEGIVAEGHRVASPWHRPSSCRAARPGCYAVQYSFWHHRHRDTVSSLSFGVACLGSVFSNRRRSCTGAAAGAAGACACGAEAWRPPRRDPPGRIVCLHRGAVAPAATTSSAAVVAASARHSLATAARAGHCGGGGLLFLGRGLAEHSAIDPHLAADRSVSRKTGGETVVNVRFQRVQAERFRPPSIRCGTFSARPVARRP